MRLRLAYVLVLVALLLGSRAFAQQVTGGSSAAGCATIGCTFTGPVNIPLGGSLGGSFSGSPTMSGNWTYTGSTLFGGPAQSGSSISIGSIGGQITPPITGSLAQIQLQHSGHNRWQIQLRADAENATDNGTGSGLAIAATMGTNTFTGFLFHALRASGADGLGGPYWDSFAPYVMGQTRAGSPNGTTANFQLLTNPVEAPRTLPGSTPFSTTASAATVFVFAAGCCDVGQPAYNVVGQVFVKLHSAANVGGVSMDVCGVNNGPWYKVNALINVNEFTVALNSGCAATVTTQNGGGSGSTYTPSYATILNNVYTANTSGTPGFQIQTQDVYSANPAFFLPNGTNPSANYQRHYSAIYSPNETSGNFAYTTVDEENDFINHGIDTGWNPIVYKGPNSTIGKFWNAESIANGVGGGTATNWGTAAVCGQSTSFVRVGLYGCVNVMPGALVGADFDPTSHGGVGSDYYGSYTSFGAPWATTHNGTSTVTVTPGARDMFGVTGHAGTAYFPKTYGPFSGVTIAAGTYAMANITSTSFDITGSGSAGANGTFGSIGDTAMISQTKPFAPYQVHGWWKQGYTVDLNSLFDDGLAMHSIPGAGVGWDDGISTCTPSGMNCAYITGTEISAGNVSVDITPAGTAPINANGPLVATLGTIKPSAVYDATACTSNGCPGTGTACVWDSTHDVGPCINAARAAAAASPGAGGTVNIPAGLYGLATPLTVGVKGIHIVGAGVGNPRDGAPANFVSITRLIWIGAAAGGPMLDVEPASTQTLYSNDVTGIVFDCGNLANIGAKFVAVSNSTINVGAAECRTNNIIMTTKPSGFADGPGNQQNDIWLWSRSTSASFSPTGILLDQGAAGTFNTSINRFHSLYAWYAKGDGIVFASSDNNIYEMIQTGADPTNKGGTPCVWSNTLYTMPNGVQVNGGAYSQRVLKTETGCVIQGNQAGSTITPGANSGTVAVATVTIPTTASTAALAKVLTFGGGTTGVVGDMVANAASGGWSSGIAPNTPVSQVTGTTVTLASQVTTTVASSTSIVFSYGITADAAPGTYTMTAVDATHWNLTAPAGGHSQSNIALTSNNIIFTDMVIPLSGTPATNDTFTIVVASAASNITIEGVDKANSVPDMMVEPGANAWQANTNNPFPVASGGTGNITITPQNASNGWVWMGGLIGGASPGFAGVSIGGAGTSAPGFGATQVGGHNNVASGIYGTQIGGDTNLADATYSRVIGGANATVRTRYGADCFASGAYLAQGDEQVCNFVLRGTGATGSAFNLTSDGLAASGVNCINIPGHSAFSLNITIMAFDNTNNAKNETWIGWGGLLVRPTNAASTALQMQSTPTPLTNGTVTGSAIAATADTTNGCLTLTFTPPTSNTDTWHTVAHVRTVEAQ